MLFNVTSPFVISAFPFHLWKKWYALMYTFIHVVIPILYWALFNVCLDLAAWPAWRAWRLSTNELVLSGSWSSIYVHSPTILLCKWNTCCILYLTLYQHCNGWGTILLPGYWFSGLIFTTKNHWLFSQFHTCIVGNFTDPNFCEFCELWVIFEIISMKSLMCVMLWACNMHDG